MEKEAKYSSEDAFQKWLGYLTTEQDTRFKRDSRKDHLGVLAIILHSCGLSFDEAKSLRAKSMMAITTEEGRKGKKHYKYWKKNCLEDFDALIADQYVQPNIPIGKNGVLNADIEPFRADPNIEIWVIMNYSGDQSILKQAHIVGNMYNLFYIDYLEAKDELK